MVGPGTQKVDTDRRWQSPVAHLRFGTHLVSNATALAFQEFVTAEVGRRLDLPTELVVETTYQACIEDSNDVCFVCSLAYISFQDLGYHQAIPVAAPVLVGDRYRGLPIYYSDVIVHRSSPHRSFLDLRGGTWAYNEPLSQSGYGIVRFHLARLGETRGFFGTVIEAGFHRDAIRMVAARQVDGAAIDSQVLALELEESPELADEVRVIEALGPSTIQPVAVSRRLPAQLRDAVREILITMADSPAARQHLAHALVERFVTVDADNYDDIRMMRRYCERAGFLRVR